MTPRKNPRIKKAPPPPTPKAPKPWDVLPPEPHGDENPDTIYLAVGQALSAWENLEVALSGAFGNIFGSGNECASATAAFGVAISVPTKIEMLHAAVRRVTAYPASDTHKEFHALIDEIGQLSARRNDIAHGCVTIINATNGHYLMPGFRPTKKRRFRAGPPSSRMNPTWPHNFQDCAYAYTAAQIDHYRDLFGRYQHRAFESIFALRTYLAPWNQPSRKR